jgi:hypothetical protein
MFEEGIYRVRAKNWGFAETTNNFEQFRMTFEVQGKVDKDDLAGQPQPCESGNRTWTITITSDANAEWLSSVVLDLGYDREDLLGLDPDTPDAFDFEGVEFFAICKHEEYNNQIREKWAMYRPPTRALSRDRLQDLNSRFGRAIQEVKDRRAAKSSQPVTTRQDDSNSF